ncbi:MAG: thiamine biosynthesis protein ThiF [Odoribacter sp.]|nr:thiamine biosynthesis protein ThiF [Odoribacter sp.]
MNNTRITLLGSQNEVLKEWLTGDPDGHERGAIILFRKLSRPVKDLPKSIRFLAVEIIKMTDDWIIESSANHILINMRMFPDVYCKCEQENLELGFVHSHPDGELEFSNKDDINEQNILHGLSGSNGVNSCLISLILSNDKWTGRVSDGKAIGSFSPIRHILIISDKIEIHGIREILELPASLKRQEAAFGKPFNLQLQSLRIAVVGLGGTGSPLATMLARSGIGELILIDGDHVDDTNLNRVRGYTADDINKNKAISLKRFIDKLGLNTLTAAIPNYLYDSPEAIDALSSSDVIFGCTDDVIGRDILNQSLYYYAQPLIDVGLTGFVDNDKDGVPYLRDHRGRVSCILPESGACLRCQGVVTDKKIEFEQAIRDNPELAKLDPETLKREYYLIGGGEQAPGVGPFTSMTADNGVATLMNLIRKFRDIPTDLREDNIWIDFIHLTIHSNLPKDDSECIYCKLHDVLLKKEKYRLDMPQLGKIPDYE